MVTLRMGRVLMGFLDQVERNFTGRLLRRQADGKCAYTSAATSREEVGFEMMEEYILKINNMVAQYIDTQYLLDLCEATERAPGVWVGMRWWGQAYINLVGSR